MKQGYADVSLKVPVDGQLTGGEQPRREGLPYIVRSDKVWRTAPALKEMIKGSVNMRILELVRYMLTGRYRPLNP